MANLDKLVQISPSIKLYSNSGTVSVRLPFIIREEYDLTTKNAKQFVAKFFRDVDTDEVIIRIEKLPESEVSP